jgi:hypothetical protein
MRESTIAIIVIGLIPIGLEILVLIWGLFVPDTSRDVGLPWAVLIIGAGLCIVAIGLIKWLLLDRFLGFPF